MDSEKQTKKKLLDSAKKEFIEKGYMKASLRNICKDAGVTTGAMYFFFKDKEDLFENVVSGPLKELEAAIGSHFNMEAAMSDDGLSFSPEDLKDDYEAALTILSVLFRYRDEYLLVISNSQGSKYENIVDRFVTYIYEHYLDMYCRMKGYSSKKDLKDEDRFIVHWMSHDQIDIFIHLLSHCESEKEAAGQMKNMFNYMVGGWLSAIRKDIIS